MALLWMGESHRGAPSNIEAYVSFVYSSFTCFLSSYSLYFLFFQEDTRFRVHSHTHIQPSAIIIPYLKQVGFAKVAKISSLKIDSKLVVTFLERWRPETHTFHLPTGECTITLEDVSMLFGLRINGKPVNDYTNVTNDVYFENLGLKPTTLDKNGSYVKIVWIKGLLTELKNKS